MKEQSNAKNVVIKNVILLISVIIMVSIDQITKYAAVSLLKGKPSKVLINGIFQLTYVENRGAAFGILQNKQIWFYIITIIIVGAVIYLFEISPITKRMVPISIIYALIISGALGNFIDRVSRKYVVDFFDFNLINFPVFNVADCYVTVSCIALILLILFYYKEDELILFPKKRDK